MSRRDILKKRQARLREDIGSLLNSFLIGTVAKSPSMILNVYTGTPARISMDCPPRGSWGSTDGPTMCTRNICGSSITCMMT